MQFVSAGHWVVRTARQGQDHRRGHYLGVIVELAGVVFMLMLFIAAAILA